MAITLVEETEAFLGLFIFASFLTNALIPVIGHNMFNEIEVHTVSLHNSHICLFKFFLDITRTHPVESEILQNITEQVIWNVHLSFLNIVIEAVLKIGCHLTRQVAIYGTFGSLGWVFLLFLFCGFTHSFLFGSHLILIDCFLLLDKEVTINFYVKFKL